DWGSVRFRQFSAYSPWINRQGAKTPRKPESTSKPSHSSQPRYISLTVCGLSITSASTSTLGFLGALASWRFNVFSSSGAVADRGVHRVGFRLGGRAVDRVERRVQRVPRQNRAFHAGRQIAYAREHRQAPELVRLRGVELASRHVAEFPDQLLGVAAGLA